MSNYLFQKSIAATLGVAIAGTSLLFSVSSHAQSGTPGTTTMPSSSPTMSPSKTPTGTMSKPTISTPANGGMSQPGKAPATSAKKMTIVDVASKNSSFKTLVKALKAAGLVETLSGEGPFTVFAPTDAAFAKLPKATLKDLLKPENKEKLQKILTYHVVPGAVFAKDIKPGAVATVEGSNVTLKKGKGVMVNNARVIKADIKASNGVIHAIDTVIMPPAQ
jgi:uncharacterized surface protein with fasciclin (FAS1) repeats